MFFVTAQFPEKWLQMRCGLLVLECHFDVEEGKEFKVLKKIGEKGRAFRVVNECGQLGHLQRELVCELVCELCRG